jgi:hypothetical protein
MTFGAILFTPIRFTVKLWFFVNPERSLLAYVAILDPPHPFKEPALYTSTNRKLAFIAADLYSSEHTTSYIWLEQEFRVFKISIPTYQTNTKYSQLVFSGVL